MIPLIHVTTIMREVATSFFIFKECPTSKYYHIIGQRKIGESISNFFLYLKKSGVKSYCRTFDSVSDSDFGKVGLLALHEEIMWSCPLWTYQELCRRIPACDLHLLNMGDSENEYLDFYLLRNYMDVIQNASFEPVGQEGYPTYGNYNETTYDGCCMACDGWRGEDY